MTTRGLNVQPQSIQLKEQIHIQTENLKLCIHGLKSKIFKIM